jgi:glycosyltransferase involved in cell wall biosynthesis
MVFGQNKIMKILIISPQNPYRTSGIVALNLYNALANQGFVVRLLIRDHYNFKNQDFISLENSFDFIIKVLKRKFRRLLSKLGIIKLKIDTNPDYQVQDINQTIEFYSTRKILKRIKFKPDVIINLFQQNFLNTKNLYELNKLTGAKIFWYLMDTAPLTGACHYSWDCNRFTIGCGKCPGLYSEEEGDQSSINFDFKERYLSKTDIELIVGSEWQFQHALASRLFKNRTIHKVLLPIDPTVFTFRSKNQAKAELGIPIKKKVIFFGATSINHKRKGMKYLVDALTILSTTLNNKDDEILLLIAGTSVELFTSVPYEIKHLGLLENNEQLALAFQAANVFVCPSIEDSGPIMINQSIMTGTPVVSFEMGVAYDVVYNGISGYRAKIKDSFDLAKGILTILQLNSQDYNQMCKNCIEMGIKSFHPDVIAKQLKKILSN